MTTKPAPQGPFSYFADGMLIERRITAEAEGVLASHAGFEFRYDTADPFAVTLVISYRLGHICGPHAWVFDREMLDHGRTAPAGNPAGDVEIRPANADQWIEFTLRDRDAGKDWVLSVWRVYVEAALAGFEHMIPLAELRPDPADLDAGLTALLDGGDR